VHQHLKLAGGETREFGFSYARTSRGYGAGFSVPVVSVVADYLDEGGRVRLPPKAFALEVGLEPLPEEAFEKKENSALKLVGGASAATVPDSVFPLVRGPITVEAWINPRETPEHAGLVSKAEKSGFVLSVKEGVPRFKIHSAGEYRKVEAGAPVGNGRWTHLAGVYDGEEVRLYIDGSLVAETPAPGEMTATSLPLMIGADPDARGRPQMSFDGLIDEVRISDGARYRGAQFDPVKRHRRDGATLLLFHCDQSFGPFIPSDEPAGVHGELSGGAAVVSRKGDRVTPAEAR
jgi:hypothetical protein